MTDTPNEKSQDEQNKPSSPTGPNPSNGVTGASSLGDTLRRSQAKLKGASKIPHADFPITDDDRLPDAPPNIAAPTPANPDQPHRMPQLGDKVDRDTRQALRRVQEHLLHAQLDLYTEHHTIDMVEVIYHPENRIGSLNYVTPRRMTAWVSGSHIERGLDFLRDHNRRLRFQYIEGLYPPIFARSLNELGLTIEQETPVMVYQHPDNHTIPPIQAEPGVHIQRVSEAQGAGIWSYVWHNAYYDVFTLGVQPLQVGQALAAVRMGRQIDLIAYQGAFPFAVARVTRYEETAHIVAVALLRDMRTPASYRLMIQQAMQAALDDGSTLIFMSGDTNVTRRAVRDFGFMDFGSIVCYAAKLDDTHLTAGQHETLVQPLLDIKPTHPPDSD